MAVHFPPGVEKAREMSLAAWLGVPDIGSKGKDDGQPSNGSSEQKKKSVPKRNRIQSQEDLRKKGFLQYQLKPSSPTTHTQSLGLAKPPPPEQPEPKPLEKKRESPRKNEAGNKKRVKATHATTVEGSAKGASKDGEVITSGRSSSSRKSRSKRKGDDDTFVHESTKQPALPTNTTETPRRRSRTTVSYKDEQTDDEDDFCTSIAEVQLRSGSTKRVTRRVVRKVKEEMEKEPPPKAKRRLPLSTRLFDRQRGRGSLDVDGVVVRRYASYRPARVLAESVDGNRSLLPYTTCFNSTGKIVAAGGAKGILGIFQLYPEWRSPPQDEDDDEYPTWHEKTLCAVPPQSLFSAHWSWISQLQFVSTSVAGGCNRLLSTANDGTLSLWDPTSIFRIDPFVECNPTFRVTTLHNDGIYSMHEVDGSIVTGSKDKAISISKLSGSEIRQTDRLDFAHEGVVKCVRWRDENVFGSCGNDKIAKLWDRRVSTEPILRFEGMHTCAINTIAFQPGSDFGCMTASFDKFINICDIRNVKEPIHSINQHMPKKIPRATSIHHPHFYLDGQMILTSGENSLDLYVFSVKTAKLVHKIKAGVRPGTTQYHESSNSVLMSENKRLFLMNCHGS